MSVDVFGRHISEEARARGPPGPPGPGFLPIDTGDYSLEDKRLCYIANPIDMQDAVNLRSLYVYLKQQERKFVSAETFGQVDNIVGKIQDRVSSYENLIKSLESRVGKLDGLLGSIQRIESRFRGLENEVKKIQNKIVYMGAQLALHGRELSKADQRQK